MPRELYMFGQMILEFNKFKEIDATQLTISQMDNLMWYADFTDDIHVSILIKETLHHCLEVNIKKYL